MKPKIQLISSTDNPIETLWIAARVCYSSGDIGLPNGKAEDLIKKIINNGHLSILEHVSFTFRIWGISRNCSHQLVRHRNTSYSQRSLHYTLANNSSEFVNPGTCYDSGDDVEKFYNQALILYNSLIASGVKREEARHILPSGIETQLIVTANLRQWMRFIEVRSCNVNCEEIKEVAKRIWTVLSEEFSFITFGPPCRNGVCSEGKKYCGHNMKFPVRVRLAPDDERLILNVGEARNFKEKHGKQ